VLQPELAYPTYDAGARLAGASLLASDSLLGAGPARVRLVWVNSPSNPTGRVLPTEHLRKVVAWARERGALVASDECYISLGWDASPVSVLHPSVCGGSHDGVLAVHSLSKRSNLAGYRAGFVTGDPALVADLLAIRKQAGMIMPGPVQAAMAAALSDEAHAAEQRERYAARRSVLWAAFAAAGWAIDHSEAGLYLWATHPAYDCWSAAELLAAEGGILVAPGELYGPAGKRHVRVALTATDERIAAAAARLRELRSRNGLRTCAGAAKFEKCSAGALPKHSTWPPFLTAAGPPARPAAVPGRIPVHVRLRPAAPGNRAATNPSRGGRRRPGST